MTPKDIAALSSVLEIQQDSLEAELGADWWPRRGLGPMPPSDPVIYRLFEVRLTSRTCNLRVSGTDQAVIAQGVLVYGHAIKVSPL